MRNKKPYTDIQKEHMISWSRDTRFCKEELTTHEKLLLDFHVTSSRVQWNYNESTKKFLNTIRSKWILYIQNKK